MMESLNPTPRPLDPLESKINKYISELNLPKECERGVISVYSDPTGNQRLLVGIDRTRARIETEKFFVMELLVRENSDENFSPVWRNEFQLNGRLWDCTNPEDSGFTSYAPGAWKPLAEKFFSGDFVSVPKQNDQFSYQIRDEQERLEMEEWERSNPTS